MALIHHFSSTGPAMYLQTLDPSSPRQLTLFNEQWQFQLADTQPDKDQWQAVTLPHDWSVSQPFSEQYEGATGYLPGGQGWYRKRFSLDCEPDKRALLVFDGIYNHASLTLNGEPLHHQINGYTPFYLDITNRLRQGDENELVIHVDRSRIADSRWYPGAGIYRNVHLLLTNELHIPLWQHHLTTPQVSEERAVVSHCIALSKPLPKDADVELQMEVFDVNSQTPLACVSQTASTASEHTLSLEIAQPKLWSPDSPYLYRCVTSVRCNGVEVDRLEQPLGIRWFEFDPSGGFSLNGQALQIKGVCLHHDGGLVGAAVPDSVWTRRLLTLKQAGVNAVRSAHNPASASFLSLCDKLGLLVQDEFFDEWDYPKDMRLNMGDQTGDALSQGYAHFFADNAKRDLSNALLAHRNHPCIFMWSIGNEIEWTYPRNAEATGFFDAQWSGNYFWSMPPHSPEQIQHYLDTLPRQTHDIGETAQMLSAWVKQLDSTRPVTANCILPSASFLSGYAEALDVVGFSYRQVIYPYAKQHYPQYPIIGNENLPQWHEWKAVLDNPQVAGVFLWTGIDYLGEMHNKWPEKATGSGLLDGAGFPKPSYYLFKSLWQDSPTLTLTTCECDLDSYRVGPATQQAFERDSEAWKTRLWLWPEQYRHWNYDEQTVLIQAYSNCEELELEVNGRVIGRVRVDQQADRVCRWAIPFENGQVIARGYTQGQPVCEDCLVSSGAPSGLTLTQEPTSLETDDATHIAVQLQDAQGVAVRHQQMALTFELSGPAELLGVDNGAIDNVAAYQGGRVSTSQGRALALVRRNGEGLVTLQVSANGDIHQSLILR